MTQQEYLDIQKVTRDQEKFNAFKGVFHRHQLGEEVTFWAFISIMYAVGARRTDLLNQSQIAGLHRIEVRLPTIREDVEFTAAAAA